MIKRAFTLAEVLITLGIIGIVAAMTVPTLVANYQTKSWNTASTVFERKLEEALKVMNTQQVLAGYEKTEDFVQELQKHISIIKVCENDKLTDCMNNTIYWEVLDLASPTLSSNDEIKVETLQTSSDFGTQEEETNIVGLQFANGIVGLLSYNTKCEQKPYDTSHNVTSCISIIYDTNGYNSPNTYLKDIRSINAEVSNCTFKAGGACFGSGFNPKAMKYDDCNKVKNELGIKECASPYDYWAGAVNACGGISKLPNETQLKQILNYIYLGGADGFDERATKLGFSQEQKDRICIWGNTELSKTYATYADLRKNSGNAGSASANGYRLHSTERGVCIKN